MSVVVMNLVIGLCSLMPQSDKLDCYIRSSECVTEEIEINPYGRNKLDEKHKIVDKCFKIYNEILFMERTGG